METATAQLCAPDQPAVGQPDLFSGEIELVGENEATGQITLGRVNPTKVEAIIQLRAAGYGQLKVAKLVGTHHSVVSKVDEVHADRISIDRSKFVRRIRSAADKLLELISENPEAIPPNMRALAFSQLVNTAELLDGRATHRVEHVGEQPVDVHRDYDQILEKALEPGVDVIELVAETRLLGENDPALRRGEQAIATPIEEPGNERGDQRSEASASNAEGSAQPDTDSAAESTAAAPQLGASAEGPGGGSGGASRAGNLNSSRRLEF